MSVSLENPPIVVSRALARQAGRVHVRVRARALGNAFVDSEHPAGLTLDQIVRRVGVERPGMMTWVALNEEPVLAEHWTRVRPKDGARVFITVMPAGGGGGGGDNKGGMAVIATIVAIAVPILAPMAIAAAGITGVAAMALTSAAIIGSSMVMGLLATSSTPPAMPQLDGLSGSGSKRRESNSVFISGSRNQASLFGVVPRNYGRNRMTPPLGAAQYTDMDDGVQYLVALFCLGYGPQAVERIRIGETELDDFDGVDVEVFEGWEGEAQSKIYPYDVELEELSAKLNYNEPVTRRSGNEAQRVYLAFVFPRGLRKVSGTTGESRTAKVRIKIEMRVVGETEWVKYWEEDMSDNQGSAVRKEVNFKNLTSAQYDIRVTRRTADHEDTGGNGEDTIIDEVQLVAIRTVNTSRRPVNMDGLAQIAVRIKATDQLNGALDELNCITTSLIETTGQDDLVFNGTDGYCKSWAHLGIEGDRPRTVEFWGRFDSTGTDGLGGIFQTGSEGDNWREFGIRLSAGGGGCPKVRLGGSSIDVSVTEAGNVADGVWRHHCLTYSGRTLKYYINGALIKTASLAEELDTKDGRLYIGRSRDDGGEYFMDGRLREFRIWNYAKTADQVAASWDQYYRRESGLVCLYKMTEGHGTRVADWSGNGLAMKLKGDGWAWENAPDRPVRQVWVDTRNPAVIYRDILTGTATARALDPSRLDSTSLDEWEEFCDEHGFEFNQVVDYSTTVWEMLKAVAAAGRAAPGMIDGKFGVVIDRPRTAPVTCFTPRNSWGFSGKRIFNDRPHAIKIRFVNEHKDWAQDEITVYDDGQTQETATRFERLELPGVTNTDQAWKLGRFHLAQAKLRRELFSFSTDIEMLRCTKGDLIEILREEILVGLGSARIKAIVVNNSGDVTALQIDNRLAFEDAKTYAARIRTAAGDFIDAPLTTEEGEFTTLRITTPIASAEGVARGDLVMIGETGLVSRQGLIKGIRPGQNLSAQITCHDYAPEVYDADSGEIPDFDAGTTIPGPVAFPPVPQITRILSDYTVNSPENLQAAAVIEYFYQSGFYQPVDHVQVQWRLSQGELPWNSIGNQPTGNSSARVESLSVGETYDFRIRTVSTTGRVSDWATAFGHTIEGFNLPPNRPVAVDVLILQSGAAQWTWDLGVQPSHVIGAKLRFNNGFDQPWEVLVPQHQGTLAAPPFLGSMASGEYTIGVVAVSRTGAESLPLLVNKTIVNPIFDEYLWFDCRALGWPGTKTNCSVSATGDLEPAGNLTWADLGAWEGLGSWNDSAATITYQHTQIDMGSVRPAGLFIAQLTASAAGAFEERHSSDGVSWSSWAAHSGVLTVTTRYFEVRVSVSPPPSARIQQLVIGISI